MQGNTPLDRSFAPTPEPSYEETPSAKSSKMLVMGLAIALVLALVAVFSFYTNWRDTEDRLHAAELANSQYEKDSFRVSNLIQKNVSDRQVIADPAYKTIVMRGTGKSPGSLAILYYNASTREVFLDVSRLPEAPAGQQYQLWGINAGKAMDAGVVTAEKMKEGLLKLNPIEGAASFQLTLEKAGGVPAPTADQVYLTGSL